MSTDRIARLREAAADIAVPSFDAEALVRRGHARRRRRLSVVGAAMAVLLGTTYAVTHKDRPDSAPVAADPVPTVTAPPGTRLVGSGHLAVAVPETWATEAVRCGQPTKPTVMIGSDRVTRMCGIGGSPSFLAIGDRAYFDRRADLNDLEPAGPDGVLVSPNLARDDRGRFTGWAAFPEDDAYLLVATSTGAATTEILDSARLLPTELVAVPERPAQMRAVGLDVVEVVDPKPGYEPGYVLGRDPDFGTVVAAGSTVTVRVTAPASSSAWLDGLAEENPPAANCVRHYPADLASLHAVDATIVGVVQMSGVARYVIQLKVNVWYDGVPEDLILYSSPGSLPPQEDLVGTRVLAAFGPDRVAQPCGFTRPWTEKAAELWAETFD